MGFTWEKKHVEEEVERAKEFVQRTLEHTGNLCPMTALLVSVNPETGEELDAPGITLISSDTDWSPPDDQPGPVTEKHASNKENYADLVRLAAAKLRACGSIFMAESWMLSSESLSGMTEEEKQEELEKWRGRISMHPDRVEAVIILVDAPRFSFFSVLHSAPIVRKDGKATVGEWTYVDTKSSGKSPKGRFAGIISQAQN